MANCPPAQRRWINQLITAELKDLLGLQLTDAFCGFKAYRVDALRKLRLSESGYAMPLQFWVQAAFEQLKIIELPVPLIYLEEERSFGGALDDGSTRLDYYRSVLQSSIQQAISDGQGPLVRQDQSSVRQESCSVNGSDL